LYVHLGQRFVHVLDMLASLNFHDTISPKIGTLFGGQLQAHIEAWSRIQIGPEHGYSAGLSEGEMIGS
ncbi:MAG: hypothetical protein ACRETL_14970, partial [Gammaproteobacteria bacterium]